MSLPSSLLTCRPARAVVVSAVVCEAARAEVAGGTVRDRQQERDEAVQRDTAGRHQPLPGRAGQVQQGRDVVSGEAGACWDQAEPEEK